MFNLDKITFDRGVVRENNIEHSTYWYKRSKKRVILPKEYSEDLVYFVGAIIGDGTVHGLVKRRKGGSYHKISFAGSYEFIKILEDLIEKLFGWKSLIAKRKDRENTWRLEINSYIIHDYFTNIIGIPAGRKAGKIDFVDKLNIPSKYYKHFLAGLIDTDGYVSKSYIGLIQKDKNFLEKIKVLSKEKLNIDFKGPYVNRKINEIVVGWIIRINKKDVESFLKAIPLRYKRIKPW